MGKNRMKDKYEELISELKDKKSMNNVSRLVVFASVVYLLFLNYFAIDSILVKVSKSFSYQYSWMIAMSITLLTVLLYAFFVSFMFYYLKKERTIEQMLEAKINGDSNRNRRRL